ncbi:hypothetical protein D3C75_1011290 [compost metagenome]
MSSGTERSRLNSNRSGQQWRARQASGSASRALNRVLSSAICTVSSRPVPTVSRKGVDQSGCRNSPMNCPTPPKEKLSMRQSSWWNAMAPASPRQASSCRPGERLWRSQALRPSARVTSRMKASSRVTTSPPANMRKESSSC